MASFCSVFQSCVTALDQTWHPEHFVCASCGRSFGETGFHERDGKPYCREDYYAMFAPRCGGCGQPIMDSYISALSAHWHSECFVCSVSLFPRLFHTTEAMILKGWNATQQVCIESRSATPDGVDDFFFSVDKKSKFSSK